MPRLAPASVGRRPLARHFLGRKVTRKGVGSTERETPPDKPAASYSEREAAAFR